MYLHIPAALLAGTLVASALPAKAATKTIEVPSFIGITIESSLIAKVEVGGPQSIRVEGAGQDNIDKVRLEVINGHLRAYIERDVWDYVAFNDPRITLSITVPSLTYIEASAASDVTASGLDEDELHLAANSGSRLVVDAIKSRNAHLSATSGADLMLSGVCDTASVELSSGGVIGGEGFECIDINIEASSGGHALLFASGQVNANASSGAEVRLAGYPDHVDDEENSGGNVEVLR